MSLKNSNDPIGNWCIVGTINSLNAAALGALQQPKYLHCKRKEQRSLLTEITNFEKLTIIFDFILVQ